MNYSKIVSTVYRLNKECVIKLSVSLRNQYTSQISKKPVTSVFQNEYKVHNAKTDEDNIVMTVNPYEYHLQLEITQFEKPKVVVFISNSDLYILRAILVDFYEEYKSKMDKIYINTGRSLAIVKNVIKPITLDDLMYGSIGIFPTIITLDQDRTEVIPGIGLSIQNDRSEIAMTRISVKRFLGLLEVINTMNLYQAAMQLLIFYGRERNVEVKSVSSFSNGNFKPYKSVSWFNKK